MNDELYHYGVKGMKWRVHKAKEYVTDKARKVTYNVASTAKKKIGSLVNSVKTQIGKNKTVNELLGKKNLAKSKTSDIRANVVMKGKNVVFRLLNNEVMRGKNTIFKLDKDEVMRGKNTTFKLDKDEVMRGKNTIFRLNKKR